MVTAMMGDRARSALADTRFGDLRWVDETGSTNRDLLDLAAAGAADGTVLVADHQTAGRGRLDRVWHAPPGGSLLVSVLFRLGLPVADSHLLTTAVGVSAVEACREVAEVPALLKWPNDVVVDAGFPTVRKLGGILAESTVEGAAAAAVVVGLGLNVSWPLELPSELADTAVALNHLTGDDRIDREALLVALLRHLDHWVDRVLDQAGSGRRELMTRARELSATLGQWVRVDLGGEEFEGRAVELTDRGELIVEATTGERRTVVVGDVVHLRPAD
jgi:BirA family transcriptional regulator, biotin operon repressor / biotin---[acetyl-CoA-carboxylase] ligase